VVPLVLVVLLMCSVPLFAVSTVPGESARAQTVLLVGAVLTALVGWLVLLVSTRLGRRAPAP
jgi:hypothetical protein